MLYCLKDFGSDRMGFFRNLITNEPHCFYNRT